MYKLSVTTIRYLHTSIQQSGHITAHKVHPTHSDGSFVVTAVTPCLFNCDSLTSAPLGQTLMHKKHPLHLSLSMVIFAMSH